MEKRVEIFNRFCADALAIRVNEFLKETPGKCHQIYFKVIEEGNHKNYYAFITYTPKEGEHEKRRKKEEEDQESDARIQRRISAVWKRSGSYSHQSQAGTGDCP